MAKKPKSTPAAEAPAPRLNCVDMSKWGGELSPSEAEALYALGVRNIKVGVGWPGAGGAGEYSRQQAETWLALPYGDVSVDAYLYLYMAGDAAAAVTQGVGVMDGLPVRRWWLDAEDTESPALSVADRTAFLNDCIRLLSGFPLGMYTGGWWWQPNMGDSVAFAHLPLWNSYYDSDPDTDGLPYGGWTDSAVEQYQGTTTVGGQSVDLNYDKTIDTPEEVDEVTKEQYENILLGLFSGGEETYTALEAKTELGDQSRAGELRPREQRIANAQYRLDQVVSGTAYSVSERATAALIAAGDDDTPPEDLLAAIDAQLRKARITVEG